MFWKKSNPAELASLKAEIAQLRADLAGLITEFTEEVKRTQRIERKVYRGLQADQPAGEPSAQLPAGLVDLSWVRGNHQ